MVLMKIAALQKKSWKLLRVLLRVILFYLITSVNQGPRMPLIFSQYLRMTSSMLSGQNIILANIVAEVKVNFSSC